MGKYIVFNTISENQFSSVLVGRDRNNEDREFILKKMRTSGLTEEEKKISAELFTRERNALSQLNHSNIVKYIDSFEWENNLYLVTEYNPKFQPLDKICSSFSDEMKFEIILNILSGVSACHEKKIIHRDLKPSNILVSDDGLGVRIIDFGISKLKDNIAHKTSVTLREFMSQSFASPEQKKKQSISEESDIYSLGILIHYIFTGKILNTEGSTKDEIANSSLPEILKPIVIKTTNLAREDRYSSVDILNNKIEEVMHSLEEKEKTLKIIFSSNITSMLYNLEKIQSNINIMAQNFIEESLRNYRIIFKANNGELFLVGEDVKYSIKFIEKQQVLITKVWNLENISLRDKGTRIGANIQIFPQNWKYNYSNEDVYLDYLNDKINNHYKKSIGNLKSKDSMSKLLTVWDDYLKLKKQEAYNRTSLGRYLSFSFDENSNFIDFKLDKKCSFEVEDKIQINSKNGKKQIVGEFYRYLSDNSIQVIASKKFNEDNFTEQGSIGINNYMASRLNIRYGEAMKQLFDETSINTNLLNILNKPSSTKKSISDVKVFKKHNDKILDETIHIIEEAQSAEDIYLIQGPPGTGKTTLISELISQLYEINPNSKLLFVSPSHVAVDHAIKSIRKNLKIINPKADNLIVRLGKEEKIGRESEFLQVDHHTEEWAKNVKTASIKKFTENVSSLNKYSKNEITDIIDYLADNKVKERSEIDLLIKDEYSHEKDLVEILKDWYIDLAETDQFDNEIIKNAFLICSTCSGLSSYDIFNSIRFDWVIIDEAARATVPELLIPLVRARKAVLVGDHKQLPPIVGVDNSEKIDREMKSSLEESLFKDLYKSLDGNLKTTLDTQFRMHPAIAKMINYLYYPNVTINNYFEDRKYILSSVFKPVVWFDTRNSNGKYQTKENNSYKNYEEAKVIISILADINKYLKKEKRKMTIGIISGYEAQKVLLLERLDSSKMDYLDIEINNVDAFQGSEKDIIIYSIVRSNNKSDLGFLKDERRLNVSLSRAKEQLIIVGDSEVADYSPLEENPFAKLFRYIIENPSECKILL